MEKLLKPAMAPYNFISLPDRVFAAYEDSNSLPVHNKIYSINDGYYTGKIDYRIVTDSPMIVVDGENNNKVKTFFKNSNGKYAIPGNTIRGLIRTNVSILGMCNPKDDIMDSTFYYRDWTSVDKRRKDQYKRALGLNSNNSTSAVRAGYIVKENESTYAIYPAKENKGKTYSYIKEDSVRAYLGNKPEGVNYMYQDAKLNKPVAEFTPYYTPAYFDKEESSDAIRCLSLKEKANCKRGMLMCSNYMGGQNFYTKDNKFDIKAKKAAKKAHYVIHEKDTSAKPIRLSKEGIVIRSYIDDLTWKKVYDKEGKVSYKNKFYALPEKGEIKPIFYIANGNEITSIGPTPYLRIKYNHSVMEGIPYDKTQNVIDYNKALFGYMGYKTRLSFTDAVIENGYKECEVVKTVLGEPRASWYTGYIVQNGEELNSYNDSFRIRGYKQYWLIDGLQKPNSGNGNGKILTQFKPIEDAVFTGSISYNNLRKDELGLLMLAILLEKGSKQNLGLAKSQGYGKFHFENVKVTYDNFETLFSSFRISDDSVLSIDASEIIEEYINYVKRYGGVDLRKQKFYEELMIMKTLEMKPKYVTFGPTEFPVNGKPENIFNQYSKLRVLPTVHDYIAVVSDYCKNIDGNKYRDRSNYNGKNVNHKKGNSYHKNNNNKMIKPDTKKNR